MRKICFSDIHGHLKTFEAALDRWAFSKSDQLFLLGDYVDRGPDSKGVIDFIQKMGRDGYDVRCLMGNHEEMVVRDFDLELTQAWEKLGDSATLASFGAHRTSEIPNEYINWMRGLPTFFEIDEFILVHAGLNFEAADPLADQISMRWIRDFYGKIDFDWLDGRIIVHGHTPILQFAIKMLHKKMETAQTGGILNIDNGCFMFHRPDFGHLCSFELTGREVRFEVNRDV